MFRSRSRLSRVAVVGTLAVGTAVALSSLGIVRAEQARPTTTNGLFNCSVGAACVEGDSSGKKTWGAYGLSQSADGVHGVTSTTNGNSAVAGIANGTTGTGHGVYGKSSNGPGVFGVTTSTKSPSGDPNAGLYGFSSASTAFGVFGRNSGSGTGVFGETGDKSGTQYAIAGQADYKNGWILDVYNLATHGNCTIDPTGDLGCSGTIMGKAPAQSRQRRSAGGDVLTYAAQTASATIEDVGTARMYDGVATVQIDRDFASVMDRGWYYIFLTPLGDTRGLYVSEKTPTAFRVRETEHGRSSLLFDYRIVAHPLDATNDRLPPAPTAGMRQTGLPSQ
jgi:hypothetical protein